MNLFSGLYFDAVKEVYKIVFDPKKSVFRPVFGVLFPDALVMMKTSFGLIIFSNMLSFPDSPLTSKCFLDAKPYVVADDLLKPFSL